MEIPTTPACVLSYQWLFVHFPRKTIPRSIQIPGTSADISFVPSCHCCRLLLHRAAPWGGVQHIEEDTGQCEPMAVINKPALLTGLRQRSVRMHMIRCRRFREPCGYGIAQGHRVGALWVQHHSGTEWEPCGCGIAQGHRVGE